MADIRPQMDDTSAQLAALLGKDMVQIRKTDEKPPRVSIIDVTMAVCGGSQHDAARDLRRLSDQYPEVGPNWSHLQFKGRGHQLRRPKIRPGRLRISCKSLKLAWQA